MFDGFLRAENCGGCYCTLHSGNAVDTLQKSLVEIHLVLLRVVCYRPTLQKCTYIYTRQLFT